MAAWQQASAPHTPAHGRHSMPACPLPMTNPSAGAMTNPSDGAMTNPSADAMTDPSAGAMTDPSAGAMTNPSAGAMTNPGAGAMTNPSAGAMTNLGAGVMNCRCSSRHRILYEQPAWMESVMSSPRSHCIHRPAAPPPSKCPAASYPLPITRL